MIIASIKLFIKNTLQNRDSNSDFLKYERKRSGIMHIFAQVTGFLYSKYQRSLEWYRIQKQFYIKEPKGYSVPGQFIKHSKNIIYPLICVLLTCLLIDFGIQSTVKLLVGSDFGLLNSLSSKLSLINLPDRTFVKLILEISIGAISAILGLIFALFAVGFQLSTDKYSSLVSDYINQETVSSFFFKFLVFTDLLAISTLIRVQVIKIPPYFSSIVAISLVGISLLGIYSL